MRCGMEHSSLTESETQNEVCIRPKLKIQPTANEELIRVCHGEMTTVPEVRLDRIWKI